MRAQHDSGMKDFLAQCNKMADDKATEEIQKQCVEGLFVPASDLEGPVFHVQGAVVLGVSASLDSIYEEGIHQRAKLGITGFDPRWNARGQVQALLTGDLTSESAKKLMLLRQLGTQEERDQGSGICMWCGKEDSLRAIHLKVGCPEFYAKAVASFHGFLESIREQVHWPLGGVTDLEAWFVYKGGKLWVAQLADGDLKDYLEEKQGCDVVLISWSGQFYSSGPLINDQGNCTLDLRHMFSRWNASDLVEIHTLRRKLHFEALTWKHRNQALLRVVEVGVTLSLGISVLTSWVCRGLSNWEVQSRGDLSVTLPGLVAGPEEEVVDVVVQMDSDEVVGDIFVGGTGGWDRYFEDFDLHFKVKRRVGLAWGLKEDMKEYLAKRQLP